MERHIQIKIQGDGFPTSDELAARHHLEDLITAANIGQIVDAGSGMGVMDIYIKVSDPTTAQPVVQTLVDQWGLTPITTIRLVTTGA